MILSRVNGLIISFFAAVFFISVGVWEFLQSDFVGGYLNTQVNSYLPQEIQEKVKFEKVSIKLFPPGISLEKIQLNKLPIPKNEIVVTAFLDELRINFNLFNALRNKLTLKDLILRGGSVVVSSSSNIEKEKSEEFNEEEVKKVLHRIIPLYLKNLILRDVDLKSSWLSGAIDETEINFYQDVSYLGLKGNSIKCILEVCRKNLPESGYLDEVELYAEIQDTKLDIKKFELGYLVSQIWGRGLLLGNIFKLQKLKFQGELNTSIFLGNFHNFRKELVEYEGHVVTKSDFSLNNGKITSKTKGEVFSLKTPYANVQNGKFEVRNDSNILKVLKAEIKDTDGSIESLEEFELLDLQKFSLLNPKFKAKATKLHSNKFLYFLRDKLKEFKTELTGVVDLDININRVFLKSEELEANYLRLVQRSDPGKKVIDLKASKLKNLDFYIDVNTEILEMKSELHLNETIAEIEGTIRGKDLDAKVNFPKIDLKDVSPIVGLEFIGKGSGDLEIGGQYTDVNFRTSVLAKDAEFLEMKLGEVRTNFNLSLGKSKIEFENFKSKVGPSEFFMKGKIDFENDTEMDLLINSDNFVYDDAVKLLTPVTRDIKYLPEGIIGRLSTQTTVKGKVKDLAFTAKSKILGRDLYYKSESFSRAEFKIDFEKRNVFLRDAKLFKDRGMIRPFLKYDLDNKALDYTFKFQRIPLAEFQLLTNGGFGITGLLNFDLKGQSNKSGNKVKLSSSLVNSTVSGKEVSNSTFNLNLNKDKIVSDFQFLGSDIMGSLDMGLEVKDENYSLGNSKLELQVNSENIKELISIFLPHNIRRDDLYGSLRGNLSFKGPLNNLSKTSLKVDISKLNFFSKDFALKLDPRYSRFQISNGKISDKEIRIKDNKNLILINGKGDLNSKFLISSSLDLKGEFLEFFSEKIIKSSGVFSFSTELESKNGVKDVDGKLTVEGKTFGMTLKDVPASFSNVNFLAEYEKSYLKVKRGKGLFGGGEFSSSGFLKFQFPFPVLDFSLNFNNSRISFFKNTNLWISGNNSLKGSEPPYLLKGEVAIVNATVNDELEDFSSQGSTEFQNPYLPTIQQGSGLSLINLDLIVKSIRPIRIKNSIAQMNIHTNLLLSEALFSPRVRGNFRLVPNTGKFFFKNNDFDLTKGNISLDGVSSLEPRFDFEGVTNINDYQIFLTVNGTPSNYELNLNSNPSLSEDDIVGLLATGLTSENTARLSEGEKESITSLGIGAIIFDRFKVNQELQSALGVNLSISPDIQDETTDNVNEINRSRSRNQSRSTTRVSVRKKLGQKVNLSVSSTVGGEAGDRQKMNVNYDVSDNLSVEGVYEIRSREENDTNEENDSVGMDLKWRLEF